MAVASLDAASSTGAVSPEDELTFRLVATDACRERERERITRLAGGVDYDLLLDCLERQRLVALAGGRLADLCPAALPEAFCERAAGRSADARRAFVLHRHVARDIAARMEAAGIETLPLKGPLLAERIYRDPGLRAPPADLDFLVRPERLDDAVELMCALGYRVWDPTKWRRQLPHYHYGLIPPDPTMPKVELHWRIHWYEERFGPALIERSERDADGVRTAAPADDLAILLTIYARDGFIGLRLPADIAAWWSARGEALPAEGLDPIVAGYPELRATMLAALDVSARIVDLPRERIVSRGWQTPARARLAQRQVNWRLRGTEDAISTGITLVDLLLTPPSATGVYLRHYYMQPLEKYARDYGWSPESRVVNELRRVVRAAGRFTRRLTKYCARIWSLRRGAHYDIVPTRSHHARPAD